MQIAAFKPQTVLQTGPPASIITINGNAEIDSALVDGPSGPSQLLIEGNGATTITGVNTNTYSGGTVLNVGTLMLPSNVVNQAYGELGTGTLTITNNAVVNCDIEFALGDPGADKSQKTTAINIYNGTLTMGGDYYNNNFNGGISPNVITMSGGTIQTDANQDRNEFDWNGASGNYTNFDGSVAEPVLHILSNAVPSEISCVLDLALGGNTLIVNTDPGAVLDWSGGSSDNGGAALFFTGQGTTMLNGPVIMGSWYGNGGGGATTATVSSGTVLVDATMDISVTMNVDGGLLAGSGTIAGVVNNNAGGTLGAGDLSPFGNLTVGVNAVLNSGSTTYLRMSKDGGVLTNDTLTSPAITYGGTLVVTNMTTDGHLLASGDSLTLFPGSPILHGGFSSFVLPALSAGLTWDTSGVLPNNASPSGTISVISTTAEAFFNLATGAYPSGPGGLIVTVSCATPGATIYYTTNGTPPTLSSPSGSSGLQISIPTGTTETIEAFAVASPLSAGGTASATYRTVTITPMPTAVWESLNSGSWAALGSWLDYFVANDYPGTNVTADFSELTMTTNVTVTLDGQWEIGSLILGDKGSTYGYTITPGTGTSLEFGTNTPGVITVNNGSNYITAPISGLLGLIKNGPGTLVLDASPSTPETYTNGTIVNAGALVVTGNGQNGLIWGNLVINTNATCYLDRNWACGYNFPAGGFTTYWQPQRGVCFIGINGGTLTWFDTEAGSGGFAGTNITMTDGGTISSPGEWDWATYGLPAEFDVIPSTNVSVVTGGDLNMRMGTTPVLAGLGSYVLFNVGKGNTTNGVDLYWNASIANGNDCNIVKGGAGTMWIPGTVGTILNSGVSDPSLLVVSNGVLLIDTGVGPADTVLVYGGRLGGGGPNSYIECNVTNFAGGTIEGGDLGTNIGALYIGGGLTLEPGTTTVARIDPDNSTFDSIIGMTNVTFGGTLTVTNIGGAWTSGQSFQLFQATTYVGNFDAFNLPPLPFGLGWSWAPTTGTLSVAGSAVPVFTAFGPLSDGSFPLTFAGESGHPYKVLTTTNLLLPLTNWTVLSTGTFGAGAVNYTNTHATNAEQFYDIQSQ